MRFEGVAGALSGEILEQRFFGRRRCASARSASARFAIPTRCIDADRACHCCRPTSSGKISTRIAIATRRYTRAIAGRWRAPTAGLHFTAELLEAIAARGVDRISITLHVGYGTFKPVRVEPRRGSRGRSGTVARFRRQRRPLSGARARRGPPCDCRRHRRRRVRSRMRRDAATASCAPVEPRPRSSSIPAHTFRVVDGLMTNFHLRRNHRC